MHEIHQQHTIQNEPENNSDRTNMDSINKSHIMGMQGSFPIYQSGSVKSSSGQIEHNYRKSCTCIFEGGPRLQ